jgi:2-polyprenyl-6-methoxyphenol hydroxylase-like FAD-dependent oxidoreductase
MVIIGAAADAPSPTSGQRAPSPTSGQGASIAAEDAAILAK